MLRKATAFALLFVVVVALSAPTTAQSAEICPELQAAIDAAGHEDLISTVFSLSQFDLSTLDLEGLSLTERRRRIIAALQNHAKETQEELLKRMHNPLPGEIIKNIQSTWLVNAVWADANPEAVRALGACGDVEYACLNGGGQPVPGPFPVEPATWGGIKALFGD